MSPFLALGVVTLVAAAGGRLVHLARLPAVTGYLLAGIVAGPSVLGLITTDHLASLAFIETLALGFIAFSIGREFQWETMARLGKGVAVITLAQALAAAALVAAAVLLAGGSLALAVILGGIATATAPAATLVVIKEYRARGPFTDTLLEVVALDDALAILVFGLLAAVARAHLERAPLTVQGTLLGPLIEIIGSVGAGVVLGAVLGLVATRLDRPAYARIWAIGAVLTGNGLAEAFELSPLLLNMVMGAVFVNSTQLAAHVADEVDENVFPIYVPFFALAGAALDLGLLVRLGLLGLVYLIPRTLGKVAGAWAGARLAAAPRTVQNYLGWALLPQAGVSVGMVAVVRQALPGIADAVTAVVLGSVVVYELVGPILARTAILRAGEGREPVV